MRDEQRGPRRVRFGLWTLFAVMTVICLFLAFPRFLIGGSALVLGVVAVGTLFALLVAAPVRSLGDYFTAATADQSASKNSSSGCDS